MLDKLDSFINNASTEMANPAAGPTYEELIMKSELASPKALKATNSCTRIIRTQTGILGVMHPHKKSVPPVNPRRV
jgi:hypothetical protein